jgi:pimeloyl-ACP methyl ester carboxylesterase
VRAAVGRVREEAAGATALVGWSFGASVALLEAPADPRVTCLALIGIPLSSGLDVPRLPEDAVLRSVAARSLLLAGDADAFCPPAPLADLGRRVSGSQVVSVPGADHFFRRGEREAAAIVAEFAMRAVFGTGEAD